MKAPAGWLLNDDALTAVTLTLWTVENVSPREVEEIDDFTTQGPWTLATEVITFAVKNQL
ncbi:hypothetical protein MSSD14B_35500 [Marinobacter salsuginis]|uniref:Uncharacterized protein n=1 Tax=Marinobacter salsuginis TaxID=418719 RepID=A0A5M3Q3Y3_9GAMM|nr:hypothetical protein MSSD14B_35500 [Marinobacter salsuginis]